MQPAEVAPTPVFLNRPQPAATSAAWAQTLRPNWLLTGGIDYTPAYYRRGYLQNNGGLTVQPFLTGGCSLNPGEPIVVNPYVTSWNSFGLNELDDRMAVMVEGMAGVFLTTGPFSLDINYAFYNSSPIDGTSSVHEAGAKLAFDFASLWAGRGERPAFSLRSFAGINLETYDEKGTHDAYWELGLEPALRLLWGEQRLSLSVPVQFGLSARDYYFNSRGQETLLGYTTVGLSASVSLPSWQCGGKWFLTTSIYYTRLTADNLIAINPGNENVLTGKIGIGFAY